MRVGSYWLVAVLIAAGLMGFAAICPRLPAQEKPAAAPAKSEPEEVAGSSNKWTRSWGGKKNITLMEGNVKFIHGDTVVTSDKIVYDEDAQTATSPGKLHITNPDVDVTGDKGVTQFKKRTGIVEGNVVMLVRPKKSEKEAANPDSASGKLKEPTAITCPKLEYNYKKKIAVATGGVLFKQAKRSLTADKATYDEAKEFLVLTGNVKGIDEKGQTFSAPGKVEVSLKEGEERMRGEHATVTFKVQVEE